MEDKKPTEKAENSPVSPTPEQSSDATAVNDSVREEGTTEQTAAPVEHSAAEPTSPDVVSNETTSTADSATSSTSSSMLRNYLIAFVVVVLIGLGLWYVLEQQGRVASSVFAPLQNAEQNSSAAAVVNGVTITSADVDENMSALLQNASLQGMDPSNPDVRTQLEEQALTMLINTELLRQEVAASDVDISEADVAARLSQIESEIGGAEELEARLSEAGLTRSDLEDDIREELAIQQFLNDTIDTSSIEVTEEEKIALYEEFGGEEGGLPPYQDVSGQIEAELRTQAEQELIGEYINSLKESADIEITE